METAAKPQHIGRKISRLRELRGIKQDALAAELGMSQQSVSRIEASETVEDAVLEKIGVVLGVSADVIKNFSEEAVFNVISNTFNEGSSNNNNYLCTINPIEKIIELYERLVKAEKDRADALERLLGGGSSRKLWRNWRK